MVPCVSLSVRHLLRGARCVHGRRGLGMRPVVRLVLGLGGAVSFLAGVRPSASVYPTDRWLRQWWDRRGRACYLRSLLLVRTPILSHTGLACNTPYHFAASRTVFPGCHITWPGTICAFWHMYMIVSLASI